jgi:iron complex outermembrane receptor protein
MGETMAIQQTVRTIHRTAYATTAASCGFFVLVTLAPVQTSLAQDDVALEEIIVTSRRYEETFEDAPLAVNVMSEEYIRNNRIQRADDLMEVTPGATWEQFSKMQPVASMRGVIAPTPGNSSSEASIQTVNDNVVVTKDFMKYPTMFDMERVEVLRGPQGTAFGRNASVGLIHFVSAKPTQQNSGAITASYASDELWEFDGFVNGALTDIASGRLAFNYDRWGGPTRDRITGDGLDGEQNAALRASVMLEPSDSFSAYIKLEYSADRDKAPVRHGYVQPDGSDCSQPYVGGRDTGQGPYKETYFDNCDDPFDMRRSAEDDQFQFDTNRDVWTFAAELAWDFSNDLALTSITGYMNGKTDSLMDLAGSQNDVSFQEVRNDGDSLSQELRLDNLGQDSKFNWLAGVYLLRDEEDRFEENKFQPRDARNPPFVPTFLATFSNNVTKSWSVFGELTWDISDRATLTYGGRFVDDTKNYLYGVRAHGVNRQLGGIPGVGPGIDGVPAACRGNNAGPPDPNCGSATNPLGFRDYPNEGSWSDYINKLSLSFELTDNTNIYALYSEGFKSGTFQPDARNKASADVKVEPETSQNFEVGIKGAAERFRYSATVFYLEVTDVQTINLVPVGSGFTGLISNVRRVEALGLELDGTFLVTDNSLISGTAAILDAEMKDTPDPTDPTVDLSGQRPPGAPEYTFTLFGEYTIPLRGGSSVLLRADVRSRSDVFNQTSNRNTNPPLRLRPQVTNWGARVSWFSADSRYGVSLWGKNINEEVDIENFGPPSPCCSTFAAGFRGKTSYGITGQVNFGGEG